MKKIAFLSLCVLCLNFSAYNQKTPFPYKNLWRKVDSLEKKGLVKSAIEIVQNIHQAAKKDNLPAQVFKSYIYQIKYRNVIEEDAFEKLLVEISKDAYNEPFPFSSLYHTLSAELYWQYYRANRYQFYARTYSPDEGEDIRSWSLEHLADVIIKHHLKSLEPKEELKKIPLKQFNELLVDENYDEKLRPTLFDFIAFRAVDFFSNKEITLSKPADTFELNDSLYFSDTRTFIQLRPKTNDTLSLQYYGIIILQDILAFHLNDPQPEALIDADLYRLNFVYRNTTLQNKNELFLNSLNRLYRKYSNNPYSNAIVYRKALHMSYLASKYNFEDSTTHKYRYYKAKAMQLASEAIEKHPKSFHVEHLKNFIKNNKVQFLNFEIEDAVVPYNPFAVKFTYRNLEKIYTQIRTIDQKVYENLIISYYDNELINKLLTNSKLVQEKTIILPKIDDYLIHSVEEIYSNLPSGFYIFFASISSDFTESKTTRCYQKFHSTNIAVVSVKKNDGSYDVIVTNRNDGNPIYKATITEYWQEYGQRKNNLVKGETYTTNELGMANILLPTNKFRSKNYGNVHLEIKTTQETFFTEQYYYAPTVSNNDFSTGYSVTLFTDRAIYRPGQTVFYKGIVLRYDNLQRNIVPSVELNVIFKDVNYQTIEQQQVQSNDFGTFNGSFKIPEGVLNGNFSIVTPYGSCVIRVEEYKRPKFYIEAEAIDKEYYLNDTIIVRATVKSYADVALQQIPVRYRVTRIPNWRGNWYYYRNIPTVIIDNGIVTTNEQGVAIISFKAIPDSKYPLNEYTFYQYKVELDATDINQETQSTECVISAGTVGIFFKTSLKELVNSNDLKSISLIAENANGKKLKTKGVYNVYRLEENSTPLRNRLWQVPDTFLYTYEQWKQIYPENVYRNIISISDLKPIQKVHTANFDTQKDTSIVLSNSRNLLPGSYLLEIIATDSRGKEVKHKQYFTVYSFENYTSIPTNDILLVASEKGICIPGEKVRILVGSAYSQAKVLMSYSYFNSPHFYKWIDLNNRQLSLIEIPVEEKHRGNLVINFIMIAKNRIYQKDLTIVVPYDNKELTIKTETFRSKIYPGSKETWKLKITGKNGEKVSAELLASMYDKSLDAFILHKWNFMPYPVFYNNLYLIKEMLDYRTSNCYTPYEYTPSEPSLKYPSLNLFGLYYYGKPFRYREDKPLGLDGIRSSGKVMAAKVAADERQEFAVNDEEKNTEQLSKGEKQQKTDESKQLVRSNLNETAFFFPELRTNDRGEVEFTFTSPEALTTWKFMAFAHSKDLKYGFFQQECITQKEIMVTPQLPRFFREGDSLLLHIKIDNVTNIEQKITVTIKIEDALNNSKNFFYSNSKNITIKGNQSDVVIFMYSVPFNLSLAKVTCIAQSKNFTDGEELILPVLPNRMMVTESLPFYVRGKQTKQIDFKRIGEISKSNTLNHYSLTLEYTANPVWYAVMAIPYLRSYPFECNDQIYNRYYANILSKYIVSSVPNFKHIFSQWQKESNKTLDSPLSKNEELKQATLAETPWIEESLNETEQRKNIAIYFDEKRIEKELNEASKKLLKNQYPNGAWGWFLGMPENRYITQYIVSRNGRLEKVYDIDTKLSSAMDKAVQYIDQQIKNDYNNIINTNKENLEKYVPNTIQIHYLYTRSFYLNKNKSFTETEAYKFIYNQAKKHWTEYTEYVQGMLALALYRNNDIEIAKDIVRSLKERCVVSEEQGMYWKNISRGLLWTEAPIEAQSLLIEAFYEITNDLETVNELKLWLLLQKQTQQWSTTVATADAIYALLFCGKTEFNTNLDANITWAEKPLQINKQNLEYATGYVKTKVLANDIQPNHSKIQFQNKGNDISWGALHWQYFENLDKISSYKNQYMSINREYYLEKNTPSGKKLEPMSERIALKTGDVVVVRLIVECDRNLEFVHIKDMRPSSFEPIQVLSGYFYKDGLGYYGETKDASYNFFIDYLNRGKYVLEYRLRVSQKGTFSTGITTIQCMYAPEFNAHAKGMRIIVK